MQRLILLLIVSITVGLLSCASVSPRVEGDVKDLHSLVIKTYSFSPRDLNKGEIRKKSSELDSFWKLVKSNREVGLQKLREELIRGDNPSVFYWDGSRLLLSLSNDVEDKQLAISAIAHSDLKDVDRLELLTIVNKFAMEGIDTSVVAFRILDYPDFKVFVPAHAIGFDMGFSLIFMLCPLPENLFIEKAIQRFEKEKNDETKVALLALLFITVTPEGDEILDKTAKDEKESQGVRDGANMFIKYQKKCASMPESNFDPIMKQSSILELKRKRRDTLREVSDEALQEFQDLTALIRWKQAR